MLRLYWKPEQPPGTTRTRRPADAGSPSSPSMNFLISFAAVSVTLSVTVGIVSVAIFSLLKKLVRGQLSVVRCFRRAGCPLTFGIQSRRQHKGQLTTDNGQAFYL